MLSMFIAEGRKLRGAWLITLALLGPLCMLLAQSINYAIRYDFLAPYGWLGEEGLLKWIAALLPLTLCVGSVLMTSIIAGIEHDSDTQKLWFALPISKAYWFLSKASWVILFILGAIILTILSMAAFGGVLLEEEVPWKELSMLLLRPYLAVIPFLLFQLGLSLLWKQQAISISIGLVSSILGSVLAISHTKWVHYLIWSYPWLSLSPEEYRNWLLIFLSSSFFICTVWILLQREKETF